MIPPAMRAEPAAPRCMSTPPFLSAVRGPRRPWLGGLLALLAALILARPAAATTVDPVDFDALVRQSDAAALVEVVAVRSAWVGVNETRRIATFVRVRPLEVLKGELPAETELDFTGGTVGADTLRITGVPQFAVGQREVLFIQGNGRMVCPLVGFWHGRVAVRKSAADGAERVFLHDGRPVTDVAALGRSSDRENVSADVAPGAGLGVGEFLDAVRARVAAQAKEAGR